MVSFETSEVVVSKAMAAEWVYNVLPDWRVYIGLARKSYARQGTAQERELLLTEIDGLLEFAQTRINSSIQARRLTGEAEARSYTTAL